MVVARSVDPELANFAAGARCDRLSLRPSRGRAKTEGGVREANRAKCSSRCSLRTAARLAEAASEFSFLRAVSKRERREREREAEGWRGCCSDKGSSSYSFFFFFCV